MHFLIVKVRYDRHASSQTHRPRRDIYAHSRPHIQTDTRRSRRNLHWIESLKIKNFDLSYKFMCICETSTHECKTLALSCFVFHRCVVFVIILSRSLIVNIRIISIFFDALYTLLQVKSLKTLLKNKTTMALFEMIRWRLPSAEAFHCLKMTLSFALAPFLKIIASFSFFGYFFKIAIIGCLHSQSSIWNAYI